MIPHNQYTLFISDLHLDEREPKITQRFFDFLDQYAKNAQHVYILGDLFEVWIGDDEQNYFHNTIIEKIAQLTRSGIPVYLMHGNRDFLIGKKFAAQTGVQLLADPTCIHLYDKTILLTHGDALCTLDKNHQRFRRISQNPIIKKIFLLLPLSLRKKIATDLRKQSKKQTANLKNYIMDVSQAAVLDAYKTHAAQILIHGHTHKPGIHTDALENETKQRIVLGAWHEHGNMLVYDTNGRFELVNF